MPQSTLDEDLTRVAQQEAERRAALEDAKNQERLISSQEAADLQDWYDQDSPDQQGGPGQQGSSAQQRMKAIKDQAVDKAKQEMKKQVERRLAATGGRAAASAGAEGAAATAAATSEIWVPILVVVLIIFLIIMIMIGIFMYVSSVCNDEGWKGSVVRGLSWLSSKFGISEDICLAVGIDVTTSTANTQSRETETVVNADALVWAQLQAAGVGRNAFPPTTNLAGMRQSTINEIIWLKQICNCEVVITGGTESGHAAGTCSHSNGYKFDVRLNPTLNSYITRFMTFAGMRGTDPMYAHQSTNGAATYVREANHWDVSVACFNTVETNGG